MRTIKINIFKKKGMFLFVGIFIAIFICMNLVSATLVPAPSIYAWEGGRVIVVDKDLNTFIPTGDFVAEGGYIDKNGTKVFWRTITPAGVVFAESGNSPIPDFYDKDLEAYLNGYDPNTDQFLSRAGEYTSYSSIFKDMAIGFGAEAGRGISYTLSKPFYWLYGLTGLPGGQYQYEFNEWGNPMIRMMDIGGPEYTAQKVCFGVSGACVGGAIAVGAAPVITPYAIGGTKGIVGAVKGAEFWLSSRFFLKAATATGASGVFWRSLWWASGNPRLTTPPALMQRVFSNLAFRIGFRSGVEYREARLKSYYLYHVRPYLSNEQIRNIPELFRKSYSPVREKYAHEIFSPEIFNKLPASKQKQINDWFNELYFDYYNRAPKIKGETEEIVNSVDSFFRVVSRIFIKTKLPSPPE